MASVISGAQGKSGSAAVKGITPSGTDAHRRLNARVLRRGRLIELLENIICSFVPMDT